MNRTDPSPSDLKLAEALLERLANSAIDDDYPKYKDGPSPLGLQLLSAVVLAAFGLIIAIAAVDAEERRPTEDLERSALIESIEGGQEKIVNRRIQIDQLNDQIDDLSAAVGGVVSQRQARDRMLAAATPVTGSGVKLEIASAPGGREGGTVSDTDIQIAVNGLWLAGAEAVDVGGQRLTATSAIRSAGGGITVNFKSLTEPFTIRAIGHSRNLTRRFEEGPSGRYLGQRATVAGLSWTLTTERDISMRGAPDQRLRLHAAKPLKRGER